VRLITVNYDAGRVDDCSPDEVSPDEVLCNLNKASETRDN